MSLSLGSTFLTAKDIGIEGRHAFASMQYPAHHARRLLLLLATLPTCGDRQQFAKEYRDYLSVHLVINSWKFGIFDDDLTAASIPRVS